MYGRAFSQGTLRGSSASPVGLTGLGPWVGSTLGATVPATGWEGAVPAAAEPPGGEAVAAEPEEEAGEPDAEPVTVSVPHPTDRSRVPAASGIVSLRMPL
ncbi:hypothetical protein GCM10014719_42030 [Planomonospora parontospora subsp. antibiotica]|nr:hypothetical protein GCM10014719_42030 [Planomonospora parontospora subsp. antibiotica]GII17361.1 hypothetical protein Ppa05_40870 [Planomonospora parontospora subsp. antibiotica]